MKNKNCSHKSFWEIYKVINFNKTFADIKGREFKCKKCGKVCVLKWKGYKKMKKNLLKSFFTYLLWLTPAIILIYLSFTEVITYIEAIILVILFHFGAMYYIIKSDRLEIKAK